MDFLQIVNLRGEPLVFWRGIDGVFLLLLILDCLVEIFRIGRREPALISCATDASPYTSSQKDHATVTISRSEAINSGKVNE